MEETKAAFINNAVERFKNPIYITFPISWIVFNWEPLFLILRSNESAEKLIQIFDTTYVNTYDGLIYPLLSTIAVLIIVPNLQLAIDFFNKWTEKLRFSLAQDRAELEYGVAAKRAGARQIEAIRKERDHWLTNFEDEQKQKHNLISENNELTDKYEENFKIALKFIEFKSFFLRSVEIAREKNKDSEFIITYEQSSEILDNLLKELSNIEKELTPNAFDLLQKRPE